MIPADLLPEYLVQITDEYNRTQIYPHICNYKGVIKLREGTNPNNDCFILHQCSNDEIEHGFLEAERELLKKIILLECKKADRNYIEYKIIKKHVVEAV